MTIQTISMRQLVDPSGTPVEFLTSQHRRIVPYVSEDWPGPIDLDNVDGTVLIMPTEAYGMELYRLLLSFSEAVTCDVLLTVLSGTFPVMKIALSGATVVSDLEGQGFPVAAFGFESILFPQVVGTYVSPTVLLF